MRELLKRDLLHGDEKNVDGRTLAKIAADAVETPGQQVIHSIDAPLKPTGGLAILRGSLAPEGCVVSSPATSASTTRGPRGSSIPRRPASRLSRIGRSLPAMSW